MGIGVSLASAMTAEKKKVVSGWCWFDVGAEGPLCRCGVWLEGFVGGCGHLSVSNGPSVHCVGVGCGY